jgi:hypothetical protein
VQYDVNANFGCDLRKNSRQDAKSAKQEAENFTAAKKTPAIAVRRRSGPLDLKQNRGIQPPKLSAPLGSFPPTGSLYCRARRSDAAAIDRAALCIRA